MWGPETRSALDSFKRSQGFAAGQDQLDPRTLAALGLDASSFQGSTTAQGGSASETTGPGGTTGQGGSPGGMDRGGQSEMQHGSGGSAGSGGSPADQTTGSGSGTSGQPGSR